jgi:hypothetical protein
MGAEVGAGGGGDGGQTAAVQVSSFYDNYG